MSISSNQMETWLFSQIADYYEPNHVYVDEMFEMLISWMEQNSYISRTDQSYLYHNFAEFLYKSSMSSNYHKLRKPLCVQI
jgi:hypothetical protein